MTEHKTNDFPSTRIATIDVCEIGQKKHHIAALIEVDVTESRQKIKKYRKDVAKVSFTAWLVKTISQTVKDYEIVAAYLKGKNQTVIFSDINVSMVVEKEISGQKVPIPLIIEKADERSIESITQQISEAKNKEFSDKDIVLNKKSTQMERFYYLLPGFIRRCFWRYMLTRPHLAFRKMGNVAITSLGMMGNVNGWFIPKSVHPICFGISSITKKAVVVEDKIEIREIMNMTVLLDHDVVDGAPMVRFLSDLSNNIEKAVYL